METVESRRLMAADPQFLQDDHDLDVFGTDGADVIALERIDDDHIRVTVNSTTREFEGVVQLSIDGLGGDDRFTIRRGVGGFVDFTMYGGAGVDTMTQEEPTLVRMYGGEVFRADGRTVATRRADGGLLVLGTGGADDIQVYGLGENDGERVQIGGVFFGYFGTGQFAYYAVDAGAGDDTLAVPDAIVTPVRFNGQDGNDVFSLANDASLTVTGGNGNDRVVLDGAVESLKGFDGGSGLDTIDLGRGENANLDLNKFPTVENVDNARGTVIGNALNNVITSGFSVNPVTLRGGGGNDTLRGGERGDFLYGEAGNDVIRAFAGNDKMDGGSGDDVLDGGSGGDEFIGGIGTDLADYSTRFENLTIGIGQYADDGAAGEGDNVRTGIENITTGHGNDTVKGDGARNALRGNGGNDTLFGLGGDDLLNGGSGADRFYGGDGNDSLYARDGVKDLVLDGGPGYDKAQKDSTDPRTSVEQLLA